jgi:hypothetical protein
MNNQIVEFVYNKNTYMRLRGYYYYKNTIPITRTQFNKAKNSLINLLIKQKTYSQTKKLTNSNK